MFSTNHFAGTFAAPLTAACNEGSSRTPTLHPAPSVACLEIKQTWPSVGISNDGFGNHVSERSSILSDGKAEFWRASLRAVHLIACDVTLPAGNGTHCNCTSKSMESAPGGRFERLVSQKQHLTPRRRARHRQRFQPSGPIDRIVADQFQFASRVFVH